MLVISHRGFHSSAPENTLEAFQAAAELGVDGIETDVRLTSDGELVLIHDRIIPDGRDVSLVKKVELDASVGHHVPTLDEALDLHRDLLWVLEVKTPFAAPALVSLLGKRRSMLRSIVISFWHSVIAQIREQARVECGVLMSHCPLRLDGMLRAHLESLDIRTIVWNYEFIDRPALEHARSHGYRNLTYCPGSVGDHILAKTMSFDGVITDFPQYLVSPPERFEPLTVAQGTPGEPPRRSRSPGEAAAASRR